jgi:DNA-binding transcriptional ArsR family regulator
MDGFVDDARQSEHLAGILKALAHPARLRIVAALCEGPENVGALAARIGIEPAIVSQQLRILRMGELVDAERSEGFALYSLAEPRLADLVSCLEKCPRKPKRRGR